VSEVRATGQAAPSLPIGSRGRLALAVAAAVDAVKGVRRPDDASFGPGTQYAGGKVAGIRLADDEIWVHVIAERLPLDPLVEAVRAAALTACRAAGDERPVQVAVDELDVARLPRTKR
jgi:hypothetical protein